MRNSKPTVTRIPLACNHELVIYNRKKKPFCKWTQDDDGNWNTGCGDIFILLAGTPKENKMSFCPFCGKEIKD